MHGHSISQAMPKKKSRARRPTKATASTASTAGSTTADGKLSVGWLEDSCGFEVKRKYKQGDALVQKSLRHHVGCLVCGSNEAVFQYRACGRCRTRSYCSQRCQKTDWHNFGHKQECGLRKQMIEEGQLPRVRRFHGDDRGLRTDVARAICEDVEASKVSGNAALKDGRHNDALEEYNWALRAGLAAQLGLADADLDLILPTAKKRDVALRRLGGGVRTELLCLDGTPMLIDGGERSKKKSSLCPPSPRCGSCRARCPRCRSTRPSPSSSSRAPTS